MAAYTTIDDPEAYFQIATWTGNETARAITLPGDTDMQPDMVLIKEYSSSDENSWRLADSARGVSSKWLATNNDDAEGTSSSIVTALNTDGFSIGAAAAVNSSGDSCIGYCWKESATAGFDMVTYTGTGSAKTENHSLSAVPHLMIFRNRTATNDWLTYHHKNTSAPETDYLYFNLTSATQDSNIHFNDTAPTSSVFTVGTSGYTNGNTDGHIAYLWRSVQGFSKFGSYTGNGNADGTFVYLGFQPALLFVKNTASSSTNWYMYDYKRLGYNVDNNALYPNTVAGQQTDDDIDILSNGFKTRNTDAGHNGSGNTIIYAAWARSPFVNSEGVPCNAR